MYLFYLVLLHHLENKESQYPPSNSVPSPSGKQPFRFISLVAFLTLSGFERS